MKGERNGGTTEEGGDKEGLPAYCNEKMEITLTNFSLKFFTLL